MKIELIKNNSTSIAHVKADGIVINDVQDALDIMGNCNYQGVRSVIIGKENFTPEFFDLKTGIAGEILQKFSTYNFGLAIVGDFSGYTSKSLKDFIRESNQTGRIIFVLSLDEAINRMRS